MAFKLQLTDEMIGFLRLKTLSDADAGALIRLLIDAADGLSQPEKVPQPLTHVLSIFRGQIEAFRRNYEKKAAGNADRQQRFRENKRGDSSPSRVTGVMERYEALQGVTGVTNGNNALRALQTPVTRVTRDNARNALNQTSTDQTKTNQNKSNRSGDRSDGSDGGADGRPNGVDAYDEIFDPSRDPVALALLVCNESQPRMAAAGYCKQLDRIGDAAFRATLAQFWGELRASEEPRNRGAALMARIKACADFDANEAAEARRACDDAFGCGGAGDEGQ